MHLTTKEIRETIEDLDFIKKKYQLTEEAIQEKRDYRTYEESLAMRIQAINKELPEFIRDAINSIETIYRDKRGRPSEYSLEFKVRVLLLKHLVGWSNRQTAYMTTLFSFLSPSSSINISYKTVERLYSDDLVKMVLHNIHILMLEKKNVDNIDASGDATGYSLTIKEHYASHVQKYKEKSKENSKKKKFVYSFKLLDLNTKMYVAYGVGFKSEKEAYYNALDFLNGLKDRFK
jgi:transposase